MKRTIGFLFFLLAPATAWGYQVVPVSGGGKISGVVKLDGKGQAPGRAVFPTDLDPQDQKLCNAKRPLITPYYAVGEGGGLANVVVWLDDIEKGKPRTTSLGSMINEDCRFLPHVQSLGVGSKVQIENQDPVLHTTHAIFQGQKITAFNVGMPRKGQVAKKKVRRPGVLKIQCDSGHTWMRAWIHVFNHPYHTVTGPDGAFELADVPPGTYTLKVWHENSGVLKKKVTVGGADSAEVSFAFAPKPLPKGHERGHHHGHGE